MRSKPQEDDADDNPFLSPSDPRKDFFPYETLDYVARLDVLDRHWTTARFTRRQRIRFLESGVTTFLDRVWGDGILFASYIPTSMRIVEAIPTRRGYVVVLSLPRGFYQGEVFEVVTERRIVGAFFDELNYWESILQVPTKHLSLDVVAPRGAGFRTPEVWAPPRREFGASVRGSTFQLRVERPSKDTPYRLSWLRK